MSVPRGEKKKKKNYKNYNLNNNMKKLTIAESC